MRKRNTVLGIILNTSTQSIGKFVSLGLSFINIVFLTRYLGTSLYGDYTLVFSYLAFFTLITDFGLQFISVKEIVSTKKDVSEIYGTLFMLKFYLVLFSSFLALGLMTFFPYSLQLKVGILIGIVAVAFSGMTGYFNTIFQSRVRLDRLTLLDILGRFISVLCVIIFVFLRLNFYFMIGTVLLGNIFSFIMGIIFLPDVIKISFDKKIAIDLLKKSIPVGTTALLSTLYFKVDTIILSLFKGSADVGIYSLAYKVLENLVLFWFFYVSSIYPLMANYRVNNRSKYNTLVKNSFIIAILVSAPIIVVAYFSSPLVIFLFGGEKFTNSIVALRILLFSLPFILINTLFYNYYILEEFNILIIIGMIISLLINVFLNFIFIPRYSYIASSYATIISEIILVLVYLLGIKYLKPSTS